eukprot:8945319-Alexandrium_andersonii.AAC.1
MATPPGNQRAPARPFLPPTVDPASHQRAGDIALSLHRAPRAPDGDGCTLGCLRFGSLGVRVNDLLATYPGGSGHICPQQVMAALSGRAEL